ncbi:MAG: response regulator transcription factor [Vallitaleaceae bacterium]|nr:response regulator transcription factor [Vallitaleaceae bacterium]
MYKLLIVDDEKIIRDGLRKLIRWEEYGIVICGEAGNGEEALALVPVIQPDIIFTDIRMPIMDGIKLIQEIQKMDKECKVVVLSGYDDFNLVRQAMRSGAVDYVLKPSGKEEIQLVIKEVINNIEDAMISKLQNNETMKLLKNNTLNRIIRNEISSRELREKLELLEMDLTNSPICIAIIEGIGEESLDSQGESGQKEHASKTFEIFKKLEEQIESQKQGIVFTDANGYVVVIFLDVSLEISNAKFKSVLEGCMREINEDMNIKVSIALGNSVKTHRSIYKSYEEALKALKYQFVFGTNCVLVYQEIADYFKDATNMIEIDSGLLTQMIIKRDIENVKEFVNQVFFKFNNKDAIADTYVLRNCALEILIVAFQCFSERPMTDKKIVLHFKEQALSEIVSMNSLKSMQTILINVIEQVICEMEHMQYTNYSKLVVDMIGCIQENYSDPNLSLQYLANHFHVNTAYIGRIFKKETHISFADYLNSVRIEKAKELLITTNFKGSELCQKVGFTNYNYFYIVFKKLTGLNPMDIRK